MPSRSDLEAYRRTAAMPYAWPNKRASRRARARAAWTILLAFVGALAAMAAAGSLR